MLRLRIELLSLLSTRICQLNLKILRKRLKMSTCVNLMLLKPCPRPKLRSSFGDQDMKPKVWEELMNLKEEEPNCKQELLKQRRMLMLCKLRLLMLKNQRPDLLLTLMKSLWNMSVSMLQLLLLKREERTLIRFLENGRPRPMMLLLRLMHPKMKVATTALSFSD